MRLRSPGDTREQDRQDPKRETQAGIRQDEAPPELRLSWVPKPRDLGSGAVPDVEALKAQQQEAEPQGRGQSPGAVREGDEGQPHQPDQGAGGAGEAWPSSTSIAWLSRNAWTASPQPRSGIRPIAPKTKHRIERRITRAM